MNNFTETAIKMHIGIITVQFPSYSETFFVNKVKGLCERGHQVTIFCEKRNNDTILDEVYGLKNYKNLRIITFDFAKNKSKLITTLISHPVKSIKSLSFSFNITKQKFYRRILLSYFQKNKCDVYHFGYSGLAISYLFLFNSLPGKTMFSCLGSAEKVKPLTQPDRITNLQKLFKLTDSIHCVSQDMAETIKNYGAPESKIYINRPAIEPDFFTRRKEYNPTDFIQILSIGRLVFQKGFVIGLLAIKDLKNLFPHFKWIIAGEGSDREELIFHIHTLGLENHIELVGKKTKDEVLKLYEESDIFFLPSVYEGIANVSLEAMSMKLPVVSSINGGMEEAITHNKDGMLSPNYDHASMTQQLYELCCDFGKRKRLGEQARKTVEEKFSVKRYIDVFEQEYARLLK